jgi:hypothetical protein
VWFVKLGWSGWVSLVSSVVVVALLGFSIIMSGCDTASGPAMGTVRVKMMDAPSAYDAVNVVVARVDGHMATDDSTSGWVTLRDDTATYDLLTLRNGVEAALGSAAVSAGQYTQIRLILGAGSTVVVDGASYPLEVSSGFETGVKLVHQFSVAAGGTTDLTLDFDAENSVRYQNGSYRMQPVIRVVSNAEAGSVSGMVQPSDPDATVELRAGAEVVATTRPELGTGLFKLCAIPEGTYDLYVNGSLRAEIRLPNIAVTRLSETAVGTISLVGQ